MQRCLDLAKKGEFHVAPNPMVGCVIVYKDIIVAEGYHQRFGESHAEVNAFNKLPDGIPSEECTVFVNLEPCSHYGKTPPCAHLLVDRNPKKVIVGMLDPNPKVAGKGIKLLLEAGIDATIGILEDQCKDLNRKFIKAHTQNLPFVTLKWAETNNGYMARIKEDPGSRKISDSINDAFVHRLRSNHQAILVGAETINQDNPLLDVRHGNGNNPIKIVLSHMLSVNLNSRTFRNGKTLVYNTIRTDLTENIELIKTESTTLTEVLQDLYQRNIHSVLVEGGPTILKAFIEEKVWDEATILKSTSEWENGKKAPWIGIPSSLETESGSDTIKHFKLGR